MDAGVAAVVAAVIGLVGAVSGALVGGLAAARGARIGAERTAQATIEQVRAQELAQHQQWLRDERKRAASLLLEVYDRFAIAASTVTRMFDLEVEASSDIWNDYRRSMNDFRTAYFPVRLLGPPPVHQAARELWQAVEDHHDGIQEWADGILTASDETRSAWREREERQRIALGRLHSDFIDVVSSELQGEGTPEHIN